MTGEVQIGNKTVVMAANAATPFIYRQVFGSDLLAEFQKKTVDTNVIVRLEFIMAMQAEKGSSGALKTKEEEFFAWLEQFEPMEPLMAGADAINIYNRQEKTTSVPKK